ncbi:glycine-rich domain-containing protein [Chryseobacterium hispalense]|uniref:glycine-rich domain-containing protein n=1 Tax=Chryseobacterium hispalense TaxID=1453492 RepID=UPI00054F6E3F|nr:hypothetical protein [Chryseobacterium hispalense]
METKIVLQQDPLWKRLQNFSLDQLNVDFPFSKKLAKEENWTDSFTAKAIEEYKKFVYLCCTLPNGASPSEVVDKVWHMHLMYTRNYWEEFCPDILQRKLHHDPSQGGQKENEKHKTWFNETLKSYREIFLQEPPEDIWEPDQKIPSNKENKLYLGKIALLLTCAFIIYSCSKNNNPGLGIFFTIIFSFVIIVLIIKAFTKNNESNKNNTETGGDGTFFYTCGSDSSHGDGGSSSCSSSCGGGCGGCGGGD